MSYVGNTPYLGIITGDNIVDASIGPQDLSLYNTGTANGVAYLNGSKILTTSSALVFNGTNLGLGVTPSAWGEKALQVGPNAAVCSSSAISSFSSNVYWTGSYSGQTYINNGYANAYLNVSGEHRWYNAPSGTAGGAVTFTQAMTLDASGNLGVGTTSPATDARLNVVGGYARVENTVNTTISASYVWNSTDRGMILFNRSNTANTAVGLTMFGGTNANSVGAIYMVQEVANSAGALAFYTGGDSKGSPYAYERARIDSSGRFIVGSSSAGESKVNVFGGGTNGFTSGTLPPGMTIYGDATDGYGSMLSFKPSIGEQGVSGIASFRVSNFQTDLRFYTNSTNSANAFTERARIDSSGNVMIAKTALNAAVAGIELRANGDSYFSRTDSTNSQSTLGVYSTGAGAYRFYVGMGGTVYATSTTISAISDIRFKENVRDLDAGLAEVMALKPRLYDWKEGKGANTKNARGFIAQEFEQVFPDLIDEWKDPAPEGEEPYKSVRQDLIPVLVKAIQEQQAIIEQLKSDIALLKGVQ